MGIGVRSSGVKRPKREADYPLPSNAEVKKAWSYTSTPPLGIHDCQLSCISHAALKSFKYREYGLALGHHL